MFKKNKVAFIILNIIFSLCCYAQTNPMDFCKNVSGTWHGNWSDNVGIFPKTYEVEMYAVQINDTIHVEFKLLNNTHEKIGNTLTVDGLCQDNNLEFLYSNSKNTLLKGRIEKDYISLIAKDLRVRVFLQKD